MIKAKTIKVARILIVALGALSFVASAQPGMLDPTFGNAGIVISEINQNGSGAYSVALQSDGKIVLGGTASNGTINHYALARYFPNGSIDSTFGNNGVVITALSFGSDEAREVLIQNDGKILLGGSINWGGFENFAIVRYNTDGTLDTTFNHDGIVKTIITNQEYAYAMEIQPDGKIILAGQAYYLPGNSSLVLTRYNTNGDLDLTFGSGGILGSSLGFASEGIYDIAVQNDGKIIAVGHAGSGSSIDIFIHRFEPNGGLDGTFDVDGLIFYSLSPGSEGATSVAVQPDGKILVGGAVSNASHGFDFAMLRLNDNGSLDTTFDADGIVTLNTGSYSNSQDLSLQADGKIVLAGNSINGFLVARFNSNGSIDSGFGSNGFTNTPIVQYCNAMSSVIQLDGKIILAGYRTDSTGADFTMLRYNICTPANFSQTVNICVGDTVKVGNSMYTNSGTYTNVLSSASNCDSIVSTIVNVLPVISNTQTISICEGDSIYVGSSIYTLGGTYVDVLSSMSTGCDSIVTTTLTVIPSIHVNQNPTICNGESFNVGNFVYTNSGTYTTTLVSAVTGCDSVVTTVLTVLPAVVTNQTVELCYGSFLQVGAFIHTVSGLYTDTVSGSNLCDSIVISNLTVHPPVDSTTTVNLNVITSNELGATYQWVDCANGNAAIVGETNQSFTATSNGQYAVAITQGLCTVISNCVSILNVALNDNLQEFSTFEITPNPANSQIVLTFSNAINKGNLSIRNMQGAMVYDESLNAASNVIVNVSELPAGIYVVKFVSERNSTYIKRIQIIK